MEKAFVGPDGLTLTVPTTRPRIQLALNPLSIQGYGLEAAVINVQLDGLQNAAGRTILLSADQGRLSTTRVMLDESGSASVELRSAGTGSELLRAESPPMSPAEFKDGRFARPTRFLLFVIAGGAIGGSIRLGDGLRGKPLPGAGRLALRLLAHAIFGAIVGLGFAVLCAIGVNVLPVQIPNNAAEAGVAAAALFGALLGAGRLLKLGESSRPSAATAG